MELTGKVKVIGDVQTFGNDFTKRDLVLLTDEQYPQPINIEFLKDKTDLLSAFKVGDTVKVGINLRGREWVSPQGETKCFNSIVGWRVEATSTVPVHDANHPTNVAPKGQAEPKNIFEEEEDDLPF